MKYYDELSKLESCLIELDKAKALSKAIVSHIELEHPQSDMIPLIYMLNDLIQEGLNNANDQFQNVWDAISLDCRIEDDFEPVSASINIHPPLWDEQDYIPPYTQTK